MMGDPGDPEPPIAPAITHGIATKPSTPAPIIKDKNSDLEEMLKPLPFFDEMEGTCERCQEPPTAHACWCGLNPMNQKE